MENGNEHTPPSTPWATTSLGEYMSATAPAATFQRLNWYDTMLGAPTGPAVRAPVGSRHDARGVLEEILLKALDTDKPTYVLFSGGRDSSAVLATAASVARREGLPDPVPVTMRHPESPESLETSWQELVLRHLKIDDHHVVEMHGEQNLLGEVGTEAIRRRGPIWPAAVQGQGALYQHFDCGVVISGEGGDMALDGHRAGQVRAALERPGRAALRKGLVALRPAVLTRESLRSELSQSDAGVPRWLRHAGRQAFIDAAVAMAALPLRWDDTIRMLRRCRAFTVGIANFEAGLAEYGSVSVNPLADVAFVDALARDGGAFGWGDRTAVFRRLFGDLLPDKVLARSTKAAFNSTRWGEQERQFAREWDGHGFDEDWIDAEALRSEWLAERPHPISGFLLQVAWAISQGIPVTGDQR